MKIVIGHKSNELAVSQLLSDIKKIDDADATLYLGYPVVALSDESFTVPATLISPRFGLVLFDFYTPNVLDAQDKDIELYCSERRDNIYSAFRLKLLSHKDLLENRELAISVNVLTYFPAIPESLKDANELIDSETFHKTIASCKGFDVKYIKHLNAAIERVSNLRPKEKRNNAVNAASRGSIMRKIEAEIANLDSWQKTAAIETPDGPQRIRGLAGSGKTVILALKAAYLHGNNSEWKIAVTFNTQSLYGQFKTLINKFYYEDKKEEYDEEKLVVLHAFGSSWKSGLYYEICKAYNVTPHDFGYAKRNYGFSNAFSGVCRELLSIVKSEPRVLFNAILIDEAQDLPKEFLQLAYLVTENHRVIWAYDDLQNLSEYQLGSVTDTFGFNNTGMPLVNLESDENSPRKDIILPICYRNSPWALVTAHALGSGVYRKHSDIEIPIIQHPDNPKLWTDIGYDVVSGALEFGSAIDLKRAEVSIPRYFNELLTPSDAITLNVYDSDLEQLSNVADAIAQNVNTDELYPHDIIVVFCDSLTASKRGAVLKQLLYDRGIESHVAGTDYSRDVFFVKDSVTISGPFRAKGNESPMVYILDAQLCASGFGLIKKRNTLFTAITRSRAWVRVCGYGEQMLILKDEFDKLIANGYHLRFTIPNQEQLKTIRTQHRDISAAEEKQAEKLKRSLAEVLKSELDFASVVNQLPESLREQLLNSLKKL